MPRIFFKIGVRKCDKARCRSEVGKERLQREVRLCGRTGNVGASPEATFLNLLDCVSCATELRDAVNNLTQCVGFFKIQDLKVNISGCI